MNFMKSEGPQCTTLNFKMCFVRSEFDAERTASKLDAALEVRSLATKSSLARSNTLRKSEMPQSVLLVNVPLEKLS